MMKPDFLFEEIDETSALIEPLMLEYVSNYFINNEGLYEKIRYTFTEIGLRIRPFLFRVGYELGGGEFRKILPVAVALEFVHLSTLVIDDVLDKSEKRNKHDSVYKKWGMNNAILIGENLKSLSSIILIENLSKNKKFKKGYDALKLLEDTYCDICIGQYLDLAYEGKKIIDEIMYLNVIEKTTAKLIQSSIIIGAMLSDVSQSIIRILSSYGLNLGYAYQIRDDIIDIIGDEKYTGKPFAQDIRTRKNRLPIIHAYSHAPQSIRRKIDAIYEKESIDNQDLEYVIKIIFEYHSIEYSINKTIDYCRKAINQLNGIKNSKTKELLYELAKVVATF